MGAAAVLATAAETPPMRKSVMKALASLGFLTSDMVVTAKESAGWSRKDRRKSCRNEEKGGGLVRSDKT
jgi:hypothetical protein